MSKRQSSNSKTGNPQEEVSQTIKLNVSKKKLTVLSLVLVFVFILASFAIPSLITKNKNKASEANKVIANAKRILLLPEDKEPTVIEVSDVAKLKQANPEFYANVEEGDYLLMYPDKAVIYRKNKNQIINVAPIISSRQE